MTMVLSLCYRLCKNVLGIYETVGIVFNNSLSATYIKMETRTRNVEQVDRKLNILVMFRKDLQAKRRGFGSSVGRRRGLEE